MVRGRGPTRGKIRPANTITVANVASPAEKTQAVWLAVKAYAPAASVSLAVKTDHA
jgi:hypothetical protein